MRGQTPDWRAAERTATVARVQLVSRASLSDQSRASEPRVGTGPIATTIVAELHEQPLAQCLTHREEMPEFDGFGPRDFVLQLRQVIVQHLAQRPRVVITQREGHVSLDP